MKDNHAIIHRPRKVSINEGSRGTLRCSLEDEINDTLWTLGKREGNMRDQVGGVEGRVLK